MNITVKEYNKRKYQANYKRNFETSVKSYAKILTALGCVVSWPDPAELESNVEEYLANRPRRERGIYDQIGGETA